MDKSIDAAKTVYHLLVAAAVALLALAAAPDNLDLYRKAERELDLLVTSTSDPISNSWLAAPMAPFLL